MLLFGLVYTGFTCTLILHMLKAGWSDHIQYLMLFKSISHGLKYVICHSYFVILIYRQFHNLYCLQRDDVYTGLSKIGRKSSTETGRKYGLPVLKQT